MSEHDEVNPELGPEGGFEEDASGLEGMEDLGRIAEYSWHVPASDCQDNIAIYSALPLQAGNGDCYAVAAGGDECVRLLRVNEEQGVEVTQTLAGIHSDTIVKLVLSEDKIILAAAGMDGIVSLYRLNYDDQNTISISHLNNLEGPAREIEDVCWSPKGHVLMAASQDGTAWVWHAFKGFVSTFSGHKLRLTGCAFVSCPRNDTGETEILSVTASADGYVIIWDPQTGKARHKLSICPPPRDALPESLTDTDEPLGIISMDIHPTDPTALFGCADGRVALVHVGRGVILYNESMFEGVVESIKFSPAKCKEFMGDIMISGADSLGCIKIWPVSTFVVRHSFQHTQQQCVVTSTSWSDRNEDVLLVTAGNDGYIRTWDPRDGKLRDCLFAMEETVTDLKVFSMRAPAGVDPSGVGSSEIQCVIAGSDEGSLNFWQLD